MEIKKCLTKTNYKKALFKKNKYIVLHYTANNGDTALNNCKYFESVYRGASAHYFVDENSIWQCVEDTNIAWSVGLSPEKIKKGLAKYYNDCRNENSINIEMCSRIDSNGKFYIKPETVKNAVELTKHLMSLYGIDIDHVVRHKDVTGKWCPAPWCDDEQQWLDFKRQLIEEDIMNDQYGFEVYESVEEVPDWAKESVQKAIDVGVLKGTGHGLHLTLTETKMICWLDRCHCFDNIE